MYLIPVASSRLSVNSKEQPLCPPAGSIALRTPFGAVRLASTRGGTHQVLKKSQCGRQAATACRSGEMEKYSTVPLLCALL